MRFTFTEDQRLLRDGVADVLAGECTPEHVRAAWDESTGWSATRWKELASLGVVGLTAPEEHGGLGLDETSLVLVCEEAGRAALPEPLIDTTAVAIPLLTEVATDELAARWIPALAAGDASAAVSLAGFDPAYGYVANAAGADLVLAVHDGAVHLLSPAEADLVGVAPIDPAQRLATVSAVPDAQTRIADGATAVEAIGRAADRGALAAAAELVGIGRRVLDIAAHYSTQREQFGKAIGTFQAVKHQLASALVQVEYARPVVYRAADSVARDVPERSRDVSMAKVFAAEAAQLACTTALQVHGAIGYTWEHDLHLWMKKAWGLAAAWGPTDHHLDRVARAVVDAPAGR